MADKLRIIQEDMKHDNDPIFFGTGEDVKLEFDSANNQIELSSKDASGAFVVRLTIKANQNALAVSFGSGAASEPQAYTQTYSTADRTHAAPTAETLTDSSGGTPSDTLAAITGGGAGCEDATKNAIASLADEVNKLIADVADVKQLLNGVIDDLQSFGLAS